MERMGKTLAIVALIALIVALPGCSTAEETVYDITGNWQFNYTYVPGPGSDIFNFVFAGSIGSGTVMNQTEGHGGTYSVNGTAVVITLDYIDGHCGPTTETLSGTFTSPTTMSGDWDIVFAGLCVICGDITWTAVKL